MGSVQRLRAAGWAVLGFLFPVISFVAILCLPKAHTLAFAPESVMCACTEPCNHVPRI